MNIEHLKFALKAQQPIIHIQTRDVVSWLFALDKLVETVFDNKELRFLTTGSPPEFDDRWTASMPSEHCEDIFSERTIIQGIDALRVNPSTEKLIGVIPNAYLEMDMKGYSAYDALRRFSIRAEVDTRRGRPLTKTIILIGEQSSSYLKPFCHSIVDRGVTAKEARDLMMAQVPVELAELASACAQEFESLVEAQADYVIPKGCSAAQILEVLRLVACAKEGDVQDRAKRFVSILRERSS